MMEAHNLTVRLMELPVKIAELQVDILRKTQESQKISNAILKCETQLRVAIAGLTDENGKKLHSNEDARRAAFAEMAEEDLELNNLKTQSEKIESDLQREKIEFEFLNNEQKNIRAILAFLAGEK